MDWNLNFIDRIMRGTSVLPWIINQFFWKIKILKEISAFFMDLSFFSVSSFLDNFNILIINSFRFTHFLKTEWKTLV